MKDKLSFTEKLGIYLSAAYPLLVIESHEEGRVLTEIRGVCKERGVAYGEWDWASGLSMIALANEEAVAVANSSDPSVALNHVAAYKGEQRLPNGKTDDSAVFVFKDLHPILKSANAAKLIRALRNTLVPMRQQRKTIILLSPRIEVPVELQKEATQVDFGLPSEEDLKNKFRAFIDSSVRVKTEYKNLKVDDAKVDAVAASASGMTSAEAINAFSVCVIREKMEVGKVEIGTDFPRIVFEEKLQTLKNSYLEYIPTKTGFESVGGLDVLKNWAIERRRGFEPAARALNIPNPKGALIGGIAGAGKTTMAKAIAHIFGFPLFKMDLGKLFGSKVGESEANSRALIQLLEALGRAVVLFDEIEKYTSESATSGEGDSGTSSRVFGTLLSWMAEKTCPVFLIGTCNNIEIMPPALTRRGRFDCVFWVDLPDDVERVAIFNALLEHKFKRNFRVTDTSDILIQKTSDFTGAEIESAIEDSLYRLIGEKNVDKALPKMLLERVTKVIPQARLQAEQVTKMREKAQHGYVMANRTGLPAKPISVEGSRNLAV